MQDLSGRKIRTSGGKRAKENQPVNVSNFKRSPSSSPYMKRYKSNTKREWNRNTRKIIRLRNTERERGSSYENSFNNNKYIMKSAYSNDPAEH